MTWPGFSAEDFTALTCDAGRFGAIMSPKLAAEQANKKLSDYLASCPKVTANCKTKGGAMNVPKDVVWSSFADQYDTHTAILFNVTEIKKEPCKHEPDVTIQTWFDETQCKHCKVALIAHWEERKS